MRVRRGTRRSGASFSRVPPATCWGSHRRCVNLDEEGGTILRRGVIGLQLPLRIVDILALDDRLSGNLARDFLVLGLPHLILVELVVVAPADGKLRVSSGWIE